LAAEEVMSALPKEFWTFFRQLAKNNNREWFNEHKAQYETFVKKPFAELTDALIDAIRDVDPTIQITSKEALFRIYRDVRFAKDKTPYTLHASAIISPFGRKSEAFPGFYIHASPGKSMLGGGAYMPDKEQLATLRSMIADDPAAFHSILKAKPFKKFYGELKGEKNKVMPAEFKEAAKAEPLIANRQFYYMTDVPDDVFSSPDTIKRLMQYYMAARPLNVYLQQAF